jgi:TonB family protein
VPGASPPEISTLPELAAAHPTGDPRIRTRPGSGDADAAGEAGSGRGDGRGGGGGGGGEGGEVYIPPRLVHGSWPEDPLHGRGPRASKLVLRIHITAGGLVDEARISGLVDSAARASAALDAARRFRFEPARRGGLPVDAWFSVEVEFGRRGGRSP